MSVSVGKPRQPRVPPAQPETLMTQSIDGPEEMGSWAVTCVCSGFCQDGPSCVSWEEAQVGSRCGSIIPSRVKVAHPVGYILVTITTSFMLTHVMVTLCSFIPKKTESGPGIEIRECHVCFFLCSEWSEQLGSQIVGSGDIKVGTSCCQAGHSQVNYCGERDISQTPYWALKYPTVCLEMT